MNDASPEMHELPDAALQAFADWHVGDKLNEAVRILDRGARGD